MRLHVWLCDLCKREILGDDLDEKEERGGMSRKGVLFRIST